MSSAGALKRWSLRALIALIAVAALAFGAMKIASIPVPSGTTGPRADALAHRIEAAVRIPAWNTTGAVRWSFAGRHQHLWDKARNLHRVVWGDREVIVDLGSRKGCARVAGKDVTGAERDKLLHDAYKKWVNDAFWLNPLGKLFDPGVVRKIVKAPDGSDALLITFTQNGLTPGDSYLWLLDSSGRPFAWRMWTLIPVGGLTATWDDWATLESGALISTRHHMMGFDLRIGDVAGASSLNRLLNGAPDPFRWCNVSG